MRTRRRIRGWSKARKITALLTVAVLIGAAIAAGVIIKVNHDNSVTAQHEREQKHHEQVAQAQREAAIAQREEEKEVLETERAEFALRRLQLKELEKAITKDASGDVEEGILEGPILTTSCEPEGGELDITAAAQKFHCLAVTSESGGTQEGYRYEGTYNYAKGSYSWRLGGE